MSPKRPALRYHGGKWMLAPWIIKHFPAHKIYVEPFGGGAGVLLRKDKSYAEVYNDLDEEIVNFFKVARERGFELKEALRLTPFARSEFVEASKVTSDPLERARRTVIKSFMGFGSDSIYRPSGFRANSNRSGTTPAHDWKNYADVFEGLVDRLRGVVIENRSYEKVIEAHDSPETLFYIDPPYVHSTRTSRKRYSEEMTDEDHRNLAKILYNVRGMVVISGYPSELYEELYAGWVRVEREALADGARKRTEVLWINNQSWQQRII